MMFVKILFSIRLYGSLDLMTAVYNFTVVEYKCAFPHYSFLIYDKSTFLFLKIYFLSQYSKI